MYTFLSTVECIAVIHLSSFLQEVFIMAPKENQEETFAFIRYKTEEEVERAVEQLNNWVVLGE